MPMFIFRLFVVLTNLWVAGQVIFSGKKETPRDHIRKHWLLAGGFATSALVLPFEIVPMTMIAVIVTVISYAAYQHLQELPISDIVPIHEDEHFKNLGQLALLLGYAYMYKNEYGVDHAVVVSYFCAFIIINFCAIFHGDHRYLKGDTANYWKPKWSRTDWAVILIAPWPTIAFLWTYYHGPYVFWVNMGCFSGYLAGIYGVRWFNHRLVSS
jgi:hypothetical protein